MMEVERKGKKKYIKIFKKTRKAGGDKWQGQANAWTGRVHERMVRTVFGS
ncbi:hypothetical protein LguiB_017880 [Lonicera macranthoides]